MIDPWVYWAAAGVILIIAEILTPGTFFFVCLGLGALLAGVSTLFTEIWWVSWLVFVSLAALLVLGSRPLVRRLEKKVSAQRTTIDALPGKEARVVEALEPGKMGMVIVEGEKWRAEAKERIASGEKVKIREVKGTHLVVEKGKEVVL